MNLSKNDWRLVRRIFLPLSLFCVFAFSPKVEARVASITGGFGDWYSDDLHTSYQYGFGLLLRPGLDWLEFAFSYDRANAETSPGERWFNELHGKTLSFLRMGPTFPSELYVMGLKSYFFPSISYVLTNNDDKFSHGLGIGGGLEFLVLKDLVGLRFEAQEQFSEIPFSSGHTDVQKDFFFSLKLTLNY